MMKVYTHKMLLKRISGAAKPVRQVVAIEEENIILFKEISEEKGATYNTTENHLDAHELFNQFTADVIKRKVEFCR